MMGLSEFKGVRALCVDSSSLIKMCVFIGSNKHLSFAEEDATFVNDTFLFTCVTSHVMHNNSILFCYMFIA